MSTLWTKQSFEPRARLLHVFSRRTRASHSKTTSRTRTGVLGTGTARPQRRTTRSAEALTSGPELQIDSDRGDSTDSDDSDDVSQVSPVEDCPDKIAGASPTLPTLRQRVAVTPTLRPRAAIRQSSTGGASRIKRQKNYQNHHLHLQERTDPPPTTPPPLTTRKRQTAATRK